jgi:hypothetical protein
MKNYVATFEKKNVAFNANNVDLMWMRAQTRKDDERKARELAKTSNMRYLSIYTIKPIMHEI